MEKVAVIRVPAGIEDAFAFIAGGFFENHARWDPAVTMELETPGPVRVGTRGREIRRFAGKQVVEVEVVEFDAPRRFRFITRGGPLFNDRTYDLAPAPGGGTEIRFTFVMRPQAAPMRLLFPLLAGTIAGQVDKNIARLGELLGDRVYA